MTTKANDMFVNKSENTLFGFNVFYNFSKLPMMINKIIEESKKLKDSLVYQSKIESLVFIIGFFANIFLKLLLQLTQVT